MQPNGSRLSCGRNARRRKAVERQKKRLAGSDVPSDFHVLSFARDSAGYLIVLGPNLVATNARGDTVGYTVGGRVTVRVAPSGVGTVLFRSQ